MSKYFLSLRFCLALSTSVLAGGSLVHHQLSVRVDPGDHYLEATDTITIPADQVRPALYFLLASDLTVESTSPGITIKLDKGEIKGKDFGMDQEEFEPSSNISQNKYSVLFEKEVPGDAELTIRDSTITNNIGGGISSERGGKVTIINSTIAGNTYEETYRSGIFFSR